MENWRVAHPSTWLQLTSTWDMIFLSLVVWGTFSWYLIFLYYKNISLGTCWCVIVFQYWHLKLCFFCLEKLYIILKEGIVVSLNHFGLGAGTTTSSTTNLHIPQHISYTPQTYHIYQTHMTHATSTLHPYHNNVLVCMWYMCGMVVVYVVWLWYMWYGYGSGMNVVWL